MMAESALCHLPFALCHDRYPLLRIHPHVGDDPSARVPLQPEFRLGFAGLRTSNSGNEFSGDKRADGGQVVSYVHSWLTHLYLISRDRFEGPTDTFNLTGPEGRIDPLHGRCIASRVRLAILPKCGKHFGDLIDRRSRAGQRWRGRRGFRFACRCRRRADWRGRRFDARRRR